MEEAQDAARRQREKDAETAEQADRLSPLVTRLLDEAGDALFGRGGLFNTRRYMVMRDGSEWRLMPKQAQRVREEFSEFILEWTYPCIRVTLEPTSGSASQYHVCIGGRRLTETGARIDHLLRQIPREEDPIAFLLPDYNAELSEAALTEGLQRFVYAIKTAVLEWAEK
jgi:hypothetical protein